MCPTNLEFGFWRLFSWFLRSGSLFLNGDFVVFVEIVLAVSKTFEFGLTCIVWQVWTATGCWSWKRWTLHQSRFFVNLSLFSSSINDFIFLLWIFCTVWLHYTSMPKNVKLALEMQKASSFIFFLCCGFGRVVNCDYITFFQLRMHC